MKTPLIQLGVAAVIALAAFGAYGFWFAYVDGLDSKVASLGGDIAAKDAERAHAAAARAAEGDLAAQEAFVASHFVATADIVSFLEGIEKTGKSFGASVNVASVSDTDAAASGQISLSLSVVGPFDAVMRTTGAIENGPYAASVRDLSLDTSDGATWTATGVFVVGTTNASTTKP